MKEEKILDLLAKDRIENALNEALKKEPEYQELLVEQETAFNRMGEFILDEGQEKAIDRAISATNDCGTVYGVVAYKQGFRDGVQLACEVGRIA